MPRSDHARAAVRAHDTTLLKRCAGPFIVRGLTIVDLAYNPDTEIISFTARVHDAGGTTTVASFTTGNRAKAGAREAQRLVEQRVTELIARKAPSGRVYQQG